MTSDTKLPRGRKPNPPGQVLVNLNSKAAVGLALLQLDGAAKEQLVLRNITPELRTTPNGIHKGSVVRFAIDQRELEARYPDHSPELEYTAGVVSYPFQTDSLQYQVPLFTSMGSPCGIALASDLELAV